MWIVGKAVRHPWTVLVLAIALLAAVPYAYGKYGKGVEFFPNVEPEYGLLYVKARGNLSIEEKDKLVRMAEARILGWPGVETVYARTGEGGGAGNDAGPDVIGVIQYEFVDWRARKNANAILADLRAAMTGLPGVDIEVSVPQAGPPTGKAIQIQLSAQDPTYLNEVAVAVADRLAQVPDVIDVSNGLPPPGVDWELVVDRAAAARYGISPATVGAMVQLVTTGLKLSDYRPAGSDDAVDIVLRLPPEMRTISQLDQLRIQTAEGAVPLANFVSRSAAATTGTLTRIDSRRTVTVQAGIREGVQADKVRQLVTDQLEAANLDQYGIRWKLAGEDEEQAEAGAFLAKAFGAAMFLIFIVLLAQFNSFISVGLVLSAVVMSTHRRASGPFDHRPALRRGDDRDRHHRPGGRGGEQQHRSDRYLRQAAPRGHEQDRRHPGNLPRTVAPRGADRADSHSWRAAHRLRAEPGTSEPRDDDRRALHAMVDFAVLGHRLRPGFRDRSDSGCDPFDADDRNTW
jgi:multidrug efflux pump